MDVLVGEVEEFLRSGFLNAGEFGEINEPRRLSVVDERRRPIGTGDEAIGLVCHPHFLLF